jgi:hypothetical protein
MITDIQAEKIKNTNIPVRYSAKERLIVEKLAKKS